MATESDRNLTKGLWSQPGVPHKGWVCTHTTDLGHDGRTTCEMCRSAQVRYVHHMRHPEYPKSLSVGCVCAGHMEGRPGAARVRDQAMRTKAAAEAQVARQEARRVAAAVAWERDEPVRVAKERAERERVEAKAVKFGISPEEVLFVESWITSPRWYPSHSNHNNTTIGHDDARITVGPSTKVSGTYFASIAFGEEKPVFINGAKSQRDARVAAWFKLKKLRAERYAASLGGF